MGNAIKPSTAPITSWASTGSAVAPPIGLINSGWLPGMKPPAQYENYLVHEGAQWRAFLNDLYEEYTPADASGSNVMLTLGTSGGFVVDEDTTDHVIRHVAAGKDKYIRTDYIVADLGVSTTGLISTGLTVFGNASIQGTLSVDDAAGFSSAVNFLDNVNVDLDLDVGGAIAAGGTIAAVGKVSAETFAPSDPGSETTLGLRNLPKFSGSFKWTGSAWVGATNNLNLASASWDGVAGHGNVAFSNTLVGTLNNAYTFAQPNAIILTLGYDKGLADLPGSLPQYFVLYSVQSATGFRFQFYDTSGNKILSPPADVILNIVGF